MATAIEEYLAALRIRDQREKAQEELYNAYTRLADAYADVQKTKNAAGVKIEEKDEAPATPTARIPPSITGSKVAEPAVQTPNTVKQLRADLAAANKTTHETNAALEALQGEMEAFKIREKTHEGEVRKFRQRIARLEAENANLGRRMRDKDGELKEKARLVADVQDEMVGMEMQVNVAEERAKKLEKENQELVKRWMERMGSEAEEMNRGSGWE